MIVFLLVVIPILIFFINPYGTSSYDIRARLFGAIPYRIPSKSMAPTLQVGDFILVNAGAYARNPPEINDVIVFKYPKNRNIEYVKRVVALEGDEITLQNGEVYINDNKIDQSYIDVNDFPRTLQINKRWAVPKGSLFVLGDNRDNSNDSRYWGFVPMNDVVGRVSMIWMSSNFSRIGNKVE